MPTTWKSTGRAVPDQELGKKPLTPKRSIERLTGPAIRQTFLDFFQARGHAIVPSIPLVPGGDETLLFTNSGMVQFKDVFLGTGQRPYTRVADSQKCMRVAGKHNDLDDVGRDDIHHTFFEMLGNWSFGDYYKREAIEWAWQLLTEEWGLPRDRMWVTCFEDELSKIPRDDEAADLWAQQAGFESSHITFFGRKDNFWEMADTGPCGPDSEIHLDKGPEFCELREVPGHVCHINGDCSRFLELWNLVFIQYNRSGPTQLEPLPKKHVDTGMSLERIASVLQGTYSNYRTDLFAPIIEATRRLAGHDQKQVEANWDPYRVIADHARAAAFLIGDGVVPGNLGRNYVTRMIIRRAALFGGKLGFHDPFLAEVADSVVEQYRDAYPDLEQNQQAIRRLITEEERRFARTVDSGISQLTARLEEIRAQGLKVLPGDWAFDLYATYGLPLEIARDLAREHGVDTDVSGFYAAMDKHRDISGGDLGRAEGGVELAELTGRYQRVLIQLREQGELDPTGVRYDPYSGLEVEGPVVAILRDGEPVGRAQAGESVAVVFGETAFYVEAGGQVSDIGTIVSATEPRWEIAVEDTVKPVDGLVAHIGTVLVGEPKVGAPAIAAIDKPRRLDIMRNHTATHLLHAALRAVLGNHVRQAGSLVAPDRLRFDFTHPEPMTPEQVERVERVINGNILDNHPLRITHESREQALRQGAMALFGEAYGETVRTIRIGGPASASSAEPELISYELCGGTHVPETGVIGAFLVTGESSVAAGIRRIEAVTGRGALKLIQHRFHALQEVSDQLGVSPAEAADRLSKLLGERDHLQRELGRLREALALEHYLRLAAEQVDGIPVLAGLIPDASAESLRSLVDRFRAEHPSGVAVLASAVDNRPIIVAAVTQDLVARGLHAGELVKTVAEKVGGGGGGKPTLAQAGGKDPSMLPQALALVPEWVEKHLT